MKNRLFSLTAALLILALLTSCSAVRSAAGGIISGVRGGISSVIGGGSTAASSAAATTVATTAATTTAAAAIAATAAVTTTATTTAAATTATTTAAITTTETTTAATTAAASAYDASLDALRGELAQASKGLGVLYLGYAGYDASEPFGEEDLDELLRSTAPESVESYPFLLDIPLEQLIGTSGQMYCLIPADDSVSMAIDLVEPDGVFADVLYRSEVGHPVLLFCNASDIPGVSDAQVTIVGSGYKFDWYPCLDEYWQVELAFDADGHTNIADFTYYGTHSFDSALYYYENGWLPPTAEGIVGCWVYHTSLDDGTPAVYQLNLEGSGSEGGTAELYCETGDDREPWLFMSGSWFVADEALYLDIVSPDGYSWCSDAFTVLVDPSGEFLMLGASRDGSRFSFQPGDGSPIELTLYHG